MWRELVYDKLTYRGGGETDSLGRFPCAGGGMDPPASAAVVRTREFTSKPKLHSEANLGLRASRSLLRDKRTSRSGIWNPLLLVSVLAAAGLALGCQDKFDKPVALGGAWHEGGDAAAGCRPSCRAGFNPRHREGGRPVLKWNAANAVVFQSTPPRGGRHYKYS